MSRITEKFNTLKILKKNAIASFISSFDPNFSISKKILFELPKSGADIIEIGLPFSDPMADGPTIQKSSIRAINSGFTLAKTLNMVSSFRKVDNVTPIVFMGYFNTIYQFGLEEFFLQSKRCGVDGLIVVDLPPEEDSRLKNLQNKYNIDLIRLVTPTTDTKRLKKILKNSSGFIYYVSILGITGTKKPSLIKVKNSVKKIKKISSLPVLVGFGIKDISQVEEISSFAEGSVVGSSIVKIIENSLTEKLSSKDLVNRISEYVTSLTKR